MKKLFALILALMMVATLFAACGAKAPADSNSDLAAIKKAGKLIVGITDYADLAAGISLTEELYGVSFRKDSDVTAVFNDFMAKIKADGTLQALADKYALALAQ